MGSKVQGEGGCLIWILGIFFVTYPVGRQTTKTFYLIFLGQKNDISDIKGVGS